MAKPNTWPRRLWRSIYWFRQDLAIRVEYKNASRYIYFGGTGPGDDLMLSTVLHELRRRGEKRLGVLTRFPELFASSPDVDVVKPMRHDHLPFLQRVKLRVDRAEYLTGQRLPDIDLPPRRHILAEMCRTAGVDGIIRLRPHLFLTRSELSVASRPEPYLVIQSSRRSSTVVIGTKEWLPERFQAVTTALARHCRIVQLGQSSEPRLDGAEDMRGRTTIRESAALLAGATGFIGLVGFLMHLARAVDCPAVIVAGGREHPFQSGYSAFTNLYTGVPCAPCWRRNSCDYEHRCMSVITSDEVITAAHRLLAAPPARPLPVDEVSTEFETPISDLSPV